MVSGKEKYQGFLMVLFSEMSNVFHNPSHVLFYYPKNSYYIWNLWNIVFVRVKMLGHWGKKTNVWDIQGKNPVIRNVPGECIGEKHGEEKMLTEARIQHLI